MEECEDVEDVIMGGYEKNGRGCSVVVDTHGREVRRDLLLKARREELLRRRRKDVEVPRRVICEILCRRGEERRKRI